MEKEIPVTTNRSFRDLLERELNKRGGGGGRNDDDDGKPDRPEGNLIILLLMGALAALILSILAKSRSQKVKK